MTLWLPPFSAQELWEKKKKKLNVAKDVTMEYLILLFEEKKTFIVSCLFF